MAIKLDNEDVLYRLACGCEDLFDQLQEAFPKIKPKASDIEQCTEFQQRFSIWAAYLGVFAQKSQCLDTRLRNFPDLQDLATRLLDVLRCSLHQYKDKLNNQDKDQASIGSEKHQFEASLRLLASLAAIDNTLARLNRLGVTIRQSSQDKIHIRAEKSTAHLDLTLCTYFCINAIQILYPNAHHRLKDYLKESMINQYRKMIHHNSRYMKLKTPREPYRKLPSVPEVFNDKLQTNILVSQQAEITSVSAYRPGAGVLTARSQSDLSSINIQRIWERLRPPDEASTKFHQTSSIQVSQGNYPRPPIPNKNKDIFACEWCFEPLDKKRISESEWRRHIDRDLKPYICLSEDCQEAHPAYSTFDEWYNHMNCRSRRWYQQIYLSPTWVCTICEFNPDVYSNSQDLYAHLQESHHGDYTNEQLRVISQQSKIKQPRAWNNCLLCGFTVEWKDTRDTTGPLKRKKGTRKHDTLKIARRTYSMMHPDHHSSDDSDSSDTSSDLEMNTLHRGPQRTKDRSKVIARHIAAHLQVLMLLTLRFAALQKDDDDLVDDDLKSDYVDIDDEESSPKGSDPEKISRINSGRDVTMEDISDEDDSEVAKDIHNDLVEDDIMVPDTDLDLDDIPRQYDGLVAENDAFLNDMIESGAWQSRQDETKEPIRYEIKDYNIAWICATDTEYFAAVAFVDEVHERPDYISVFDCNHYTFGRIGRHNVIVATSPIFAQSGAATVVEDILYTFHNIRVCLLVGIGGGAPSANHDIRLGDVIVDCSSLATEGGIIQHESEWTTLSRGYAPKILLSQPPVILQRAIEVIRSRYREDGHMLKETIDAALDTYGTLRERYNRPTIDVLYRSQFVHLLDHETDCAAVCGYDPSNFIQRPQQVQGVEGHPTIHYGFIASTTSKLKDALLRDKLAEQENILCFETEAAGLMNHFPCVVIRGVCDYADSHHNENWQGYAAITASAYANDLLGELSPAQVEAENTVGEILSMKSQRVYPPIELQPNS